MVLVEPRRRPFLRDGRDPYRPHVAALLAPAPLRLIRRMPQGTRHEVTGMLLRSDDVGGLVLDVPGGGAWRLDLGIVAAWRARRLVGMRVRVAGVRDGFDLLAGETIERAR